MKENKKVVRDPIHGNIKIEGFLVELLESPEIQRLYNIKQLGFAYLVFPGAHHTRLEHSLGVYHIASMITESLDIKPEEKDIVTCAALLHDIGHGPFSHTLESILMEKIGVDHIDLTEKLLFGDYEIFEPGERDYIQSDSAHEILSNNGIYKEEVVNVIRGKYSNKSYMGQILNSTIDVDQLDYLVRDAYYTGVAYGMIDIERLLQTLAIYNNNLIIKRKGVGVVENILMARGLMYSSVYFHKTVRIAELMLSRAIEIIPDLEPFEFFRMTDSEIVNTLKNIGGFQQEIITRLKYRILFKQAYSASFHDLDESNLKIIKKLEDADFRRQKEREFETAFNIPRGHIIIDIPRPELIMAEPRLVKTDICVVDKNEMKILDDFTPIAEAIRSRITPDWTVMIITDEKYRDVVSKKAESFLYK